MDRFCTNCGKKAIGNELYCKKCGTKLEPLGKVKVDDEVILVTSESNALCLIWPVVVFLAGIALSSIAPVFLIISLIATIWFVIRYIAFSRSVLILTNKNVRGKCGLIFRKEMESPLNKVSSVYVSSGLVGNFLGYGTVGIATDSAIYKFKFISQRKSLKSSIFEQIQIVDKERIINQAEEIAKAIKKNN